MKNFKVISNASLAACSLLASMKTVEISPKKIIKNGKAVPAAIAASVPTNSINLSFESAYLNNPKKETVFTGCSSAGFSF
jgi:hypothetical protein